MSIIPSEREYQNTCFGIAVKFRSLSCKMCKTIGLWFLVLFLSLDISLSEKFLQSTWNLTDGLDCLPYEVEHGTMTILDRGEDPFEVATIACVHGYNLQGPSRVTCINGQWIQTSAPHCEPGCFAPPSINNGGKHLIFCCCV